jgi:hypothetical protein
MYMFIHTHLNQFWFLVSDCSTAHISENSLTSVAIMLTFVMWEFK